MSAAVVGRWVAVLMFAHFMATCFWPGWKTAGTDFPNYYTAAFAVSKGEHSLRDFYDWTWFQREMNEAGIERQLGAYSPQSPLTMLPILPLAALPLQSAKRIWLIANLAFLMATIGLLSRVTGRRIEYVAILAFAGYTSLRTNFLLGQYYVFLLFLLTLTFYLLARTREGWSGTVAGSAFALKLYAGPLLLCFAVLRKWRAVISMIVTIVIAVCIAVAMFGWRDVWLYLTWILPGSLKCGSADPFNPADPTLSTLFRRLFMFDPDLNPRPLVNAPYLFFFLQAFAGLAILTFTTLAIAQKRTNTTLRNFALYTLALVLISTNVASYTYVLLLLPVVIVLEDAGPFESVYVVASYLLLCASLRGGFLFPKVWLLLALLVVTGRHFWPLIPRRVTAVTIVALTLIAFWQARVRMVDYLSQPAQRFERIPMQTGTLFSAFPAFHQAGMFYQSMGRDRYVLSWRRGGHTEELVFDGSAFHPRVLNPLGPVYFELAGHRSSRVMAFDPATRSLTASSMPLTSDQDDSVISPDGRWLAFTSIADGPAHVYIRRLPNGKATRLTGGDCNSWGPAWQLDGKALAFASDCGRAMGLPTLYSAKMR